MAMGARQLLLLLPVLLLSASRCRAFDADRCGCDPTVGPWTVDTVLQWQKASDFLIAASYFSIPLELLYFATCSYLFPFKWILLLFGAFIVLCGLTHILTVFTYAPHSFALLLSLTVAKFLTAVVSFATAVALLTLIPQLLRAKVRENFLRAKARELDREVVLMKRQEEAGWHVRMLTREIRRSLDRHTILYTTIDELSAALGLLNCAVWMPDDARGEMILTHQPRHRRAPAVAMSDPDVAAVRDAKGVRILSSQSALAQASAVGFVDVGPVAAIRMPMLRVSNFKGGTPEVMQAKYSILVLVLPADGERSWSSHELEIVEVVADQVAVALSHAALLEESQLMREKLAEQHRVLLHARYKAMMANEAWSSFQSVMGRVMRPPQFSIMALLSIMAQEKLSPEQRLVVNAIAKTGGVVSMLIDDVVATSAMDRDQLPLTMRPFLMHAMIKEALSVVKCLCGLSGIKFGYHVDTTVEDRVIGDEKRVLHVLLHMVCAMLSQYKKGSLELSIRRRSKDDGDLDRMPWRAKYAQVKFEVCMWKDDGGIAGSSAVHPSQRWNAGSREDSRSFLMCKKLVLMMNGDIWSTPNDEGLTRSMTLVLQFQQHSSNQAPPAPAAGPSSVPNLKGLRVLLVDDDDANRAVSCILLEKLGCRVTASASGIRCLSLLDAADTLTPYQCVILDLSLPMMDGFEVAARIRRSGKANWPLIVALTASSDDSVWDQCLRRGINGLIRKPVTLASMAEELRRVLHQVLVR